MNTTKINFKENPKIKTCIDQDKKISKDIPKSGCKNNTDIIKIKNTKLRFKE